MGYRTRQNVSRQQQTGRTDEGAEKDKPCCTARKGQGEKGIGSTHTERSEIEIEGTPNAPEKQNKKTTNKTDKTHPTPSQFPTAVRASRARGC
jgi:hypothetical protein